MKYDFEYGDFKDRHVEDFDFPCSSLFREYYNQTYGNPIHEHRITRFIEVVSEGEAYELAKSAMGVATGARRLAQSLDKKEEMLSNKGRGGDTYTIT